MTCSACGHELEIGDYPFCPHESIYPVRAQRFDPIIVWQSNADPDKYSFPGQSGESVPEGYHKIAITNLREADRFVARMNDIEGRRLEVERDMRRALDDAGVRDRRAEEDARGWVMKADGTKFYVRGNARAEMLRRRVREWADKRRDERRSRNQRIDPRFHIDVLSYDSGNRNSYSGPETNWRERKA